MNTKLLKITFLIAAFTSFPLMAYINISAKADVIWPKGIIKSIGVADVKLSRTGEPLDSENGSEITINHGRIQAYNRARDYALEGLVKRLHNLRINPEKRLKDLIDSNSLTRERLTEMISSRVKYREKPVSFIESGCEAILRISDIIPALPYTYPSDPFPRRMDNPVKTSYTSLIIDSRGLKTEPMILPSVYNEKGLEIYGKNFVNIRAVNKHGMATYVYNEDDATSCKIAGKRPFFSVAIKSLKDCPVLSENDIRKIFSSENTLKNLRECRVILIINRNTK